MITSEELENFDIFPKEYSFTCLFKFIFYCLFSMLGFLVLFSFYTDSNLLSLVTFNFSEANPLNMNINDYFTNKIAELHPKNYYSNQSIFIKSYSKEFVHNFYKEYLLNSFPCLIKNSNDGFNISNIVNYIKHELYVNDKKFYVEIREDPFGEFFKKDFKYFKTTYNFLHNDNKNLDLVKKMNYFINDLNIDDVINKGKYEIINNFLNNNEILSEMIIKTITYNEVKKFVVVSGHMEITNNFLCVNEGDIDLLLIPPQDKKYVYPFIGEGPENYSRVNFFYNGKEMGKFPEFSKSTKIYVNLNRGDCLFIPAFWWMSLKTNNKENDNKIDTKNEFIIFKYESNSKYLDYITKVLI